MRVLVSFSEITAVLSGFRLEFGVTEVLRLGFRSSVCWLRSAQVKGREDEEMLMKE
jgi:hypothetical protein